MFAHDLIPTLLIVLIPGESVDQELLRAPAMLLHCFLNEVDSDLNWNDLALKDNTVDQIAIWGTAISLEARGQI